MHYIANTGGLLLGLTGAGVLAWIVSSQPEVPGWTGTHLEVSTVSPVGTPWMCHCTRLT